MKSKLYHTYLKVGQQLIYFEKKKKKKKRNLPLVSDLDVVGGLSTNMRPL
jgi:hypothetical protein